MDHRIKPGGDAFMSNPPVLPDPKAVPAEIDRWNWGAFLLNWLWGIGNQTYIALLTLIPVVGLIMIFVLGAKGSAWAWRNGRWDNIEHFKRVQRRWALAGVAVWIGALVLGGGILVGVFQILKHSEAYQMAVAKLEASPVAKSMLDSPISTGTPFGQVSINGGSGRAALNFSATGPKAAGVVFVEAVKRDGVWSITHLALKLNDSGKVIDLIGGAKGDTT